MDFNLFHRASGVCTLTRLIRGLSDSLERASKRAPMLMSLFKVWRGMIPRIPSIGGPNTERWQIERLQFGLPWHEIESTVKIDPKVFL